jgi:radical SAM superfamily enzyme YgiQ (UPF0313 family)
MPNVLLTTVCRPFGQPGDGDSVSAELFHAQITRSQGVFSFRQVIRCWGLDYIGENLEAPCTVLHYPSRRELVRELKSRDYDYIGINFVVSTYHKLIKMVPLIRRHAPRAKIVLGGYGTVLPDDMLTPYSDRICREEGIGFMRRLLGENDHALKHPYAPIPSINLYHCMFKAKVAHITGGLGCPNGCDFCCTSHFFKRRYVPFINSGRELYNTILQMERQAEEAGDELSGFIFIDEDFFLHKKRAREFLECVREGGKRISVMGFGSAKGLSNFTADEIAEMGFETIWTAFEGVEAGYEKLKGQPIAELYSALKARGVNVLASMIIGFPYQDRATIMREFGQLMALKPSLAQILIYFAFPGTPFYERAKAEDLYLPEYKDDPDFRRFDGFSMHFKHPNFTARELEALQRELYRQDYERLGSSLIRFVGTLFQGYQNLRGSDRPLLRQRAEKMKTYARSACPALVPAAWLSPTRATRAEAKQLIAEIIAATHPFTAGDRLMSAGAMVMAGWTWLSEKLNIYQQPALLRVEYGMDPVNRRATAVNRIQGGFYANPLAVLAEDLAGNARLLASRLWTWLVKKPAEANG